MIATKLDMSPNIVNCLVNVSEKAANIARLMRQHDYLFSLLVQEKSIDESNSERFVHDYKTLADVLIQQTVRHDIGVSVCMLYIQKLEEEKKLCETFCFHFVYEKFNFIFIYVFFPKSSISMHFQFPELLNNIKGEESSTFTNSLGETVTIEVFDDQSDTSACLLKVLNGDSVAAELLAEEVHKTVDTNMDSIPELPDGLNYSNMGIWVDPIGKCDKSISAKPITQLCVRFFVLQMQRKNTFEAQQ